MGEDGTRLLSWPSKLPTNTWDTSSGTVTGRTVTLPGVRAAPGHVERARYLKRRVEDPSFLWSCNRTCAHPAGRDRTCTEVPPTKTLKNRSCGIRTGSQLREWPGHDGLCAHDL